MNPARNLLVPIDFSSQSEDALDYAIGLATKLDATIHLVHVIGLPAIGVPELGLALSSSVIEQLVTQNEAALEKIAAARRAAGAKIGEVLLRTGDAREMILHAAEQVKADLIVMGTHGRRGLSRALLGSVAEWIVRVSPVPVLTVRKRVS